MVTIEQEAARDFAIEVVRRLRDAGYEALWAGGCVRDRLLGKRPKDFDVATNATPPQIREVFRDRRTLNMGAAFGVVAVLGPRRAGQVEVATFRKDLGYSDGRHPDRVQFSTAREDALRRDFTINGLFFDPLQEELVDYVDGQQDLLRQRVRAIGDPHERIDEDKLRMLRAVRFATVLGFVLDDATAKAIRQHAPEIKCVSAERIAQELEKTLVHSNRKTGLELLRSTRLLWVLMPELQAAQDLEPDWQQYVEIFTALHEPNFGICLAALIRPLVGRDDLLNETEKIARRWKLANEVRQTALFCLQHEELVRSAPSVPWPQLQRVLIEDRVEELLTYATAVARVIDGSTEAIEFCRQKRALPANELNPPPLISGDDLKELNIPRGPAYRDILTNVRDAQLDGHVTSRAAALELASKRWEEQKTD